VLFVGLIEKTNFVADFSGLKLEGDAEVPFFNDDNRSTHNRPSGGKER
jgi:hypothetical protein